MKSFSVQYVFAAVFFVLSFAMSSCKKSAYYEGELLAELHTLSTAPQVNDKSNSGVDTYIDFSSGMYEAMYASMDRLVGDALTMLKQEGTTYYRVGFKAPYKIDIQAKENIPTTISNYQDDMSILDEPLAMITDNPQKESVYITDFELVKSLERLHEAKDCSGKLLKLQLNPNAWAVEYFEKWLKQGHQIDVYASCFERTNKAVSKSQTQHLYVLVFTPKHLIEDPKSLRMRFQEKFQSRFSNDLKYFSFGNYSIRHVANKDFNAQQGGLHESIAPMEDVLQFQSAQYYNIEFASAQKYVAQDASNSDKRLIKGIFINQATFKDVSLALKVHKYTEEYGRYEEFKTGATEADNETEIDPESGDTLKKARVSKGSRFSAGRGMPQENVFEVVLNKSTGEIGLKIHPDFGGPEVSGELYRVDIYVDKARYEAPSGMAETLQWQDARCFMVRSLHESLLEAMARTEKNLNEQPIFTYYIALK